MDGVGGPTSPRRAAVTLGVCLALGLGAGVAVTVSAEPDASASAVAGLVEDNLGTGAADVVRDAYEAARAGERTSPPESAQEAANGTRAGLEVAGDSVTAQAPATTPGEPVTRKSAPPSPRPASAAPSAHPSAGPGPTAEPGSGIVGARPAVREKLSGRLLVARGSRPAPAQGKVWRVQVAVEKGLPVDRQVFAEAVLDTLNDPRGWNAADGSTFAWTDSDRYDVRVVLASPGTTDELCLPLDTIGELSCGIEGTAVLNFKRWATGSSAWENTRRYRQYLVNHEVGHVIGHRHDLCAGEGEHATVMVQQTTTTSGCVPEPWPAPGAR